MLRPLALLALGLALLAGGAPVSAGTRAAKPLVACQLIRSGELAGVLGRPAVIRRGATRFQCIFRGGSLLPITATAGTSGRAGYRSLIRSIGATTRRLRGVGTEAVTYDHLSEDPERHTRGVIVRKGARVLHLSTGDVGFDPPGLPELRQVVALARIAVRRL